MSSPERVKSSFFRKSRRLATSLIVRVSADLKPVRWVPPSWVLMLFTKVNVFSLYPSSYCRARSTSTSSLVALNAIGLGCSGFLFRLSHCTNSHQAALGEEGLLLLLVLALVLDRDA